eukprot:jgi/Astpho2/9128/Aster-x1563
MGAVASHDSFSGCSAPKRTKQTARKTAKRVQQDVIIISDSGDEAPPTKRRQISPATPSISAKPGAVKSLPGNPSAVDAYCSLARTAQVVPGHDVMLTQTNIGKNSNKFYSLQWLRQPGRTLVGDKGQSKLLGPFPPEEAKKEFKSKFRPSGEQHCLPCKLPAATRQLMELMFEEKMFQEVMKGFELDMVRMPLGQLSTAQVQRGYHVLRRLRNALAGLTSDSLETLSTEFYTTIPHSFKQSRPPVTNTAKALDRKLEMLDVLSDIEDLLGHAADGTTGSQLPPHPADTKYRTLGADLQVVHRLEQEYQIIDQCMKATSSNLQLLDLWKVNRRGEGKAFQAHAHLDNRRLLWHGTNFATVAAVLKAGLRIMPHASGRVGRGLYMVMFLAEAALGREHHIIRDNPSLRRPPSVAKGVRAPHPSTDKVLELDRRLVKVPVGAPVPAQQFAQSSCLQVKRQQKATSGWRDGAEPLVPI